MGYPQGCGQVDNQVKLEVRYCKDSSLIKNRNAKRGGDVEKVEESVNELKVKDLLGKW